VWGWGLAPTPTPLNYLNCKFKFYKFEIIIKFNIKIFNKI